MPQTHRLAAIMFTDIVGYTVMMQRDQKEAISVVREYERVLKNRITAHQGELVHTYGDGSLSVFDSATAAVQCAREIQEAIRHKVPLRIGLHIGEITRDGDHTFGDGVNIASRIESMGVAGAVLMSQNMHEKIRNKSDLSTVLIGQFTFKNVAGRMPVYALSNEGFRIPHKTEMKGKGKAASRLNPSGLIAGALLLCVLLAIVLWQGFRQDAGETEKSIAILPFENLSNDPEQEYFSDGISQDILANLSGIRDLLVISFNSSRLYRDTEKTSSEIGEELGARHLVSGSVQRNGEQLRIRAMLIETTTDRQLWGKTYDLQLQDMFQVQSQVAREIAGVLKTELLPAEIQRIEVQQTENLEAWQEYSQGRYHWEKRGNANLIKAGQYFAEAVRLDSTFAQAYAMLAQTYLLMGIGHLYPRDSLLRVSAHLARKAIQLDPANSDAYAALANDLYYGGEASFSMDSAIALAEKSVSLQPTNATAHQWLAEKLIQSGQISRAKEEISIAQRLSPGSAIIQLVQAHVLLSEDKYEAAQAKLETLLMQNPDIAIINYTLYRTYLETGAEKKALGIRDDIWIYQKEINRLTLQGKKDSLLALQETIKRLAPFPRKPSILYKLENSLLRLTGKTDRYVERLDSLYFILPLDRPDFLQLFPPADSIRLHPRFQRMLQERGIALRPRSKQLL